MIPTAVALRLILLLTVCLLAAGCDGGERRAAVSIPAGLAVRTESLASQSVCAAARGPLGYGWPIKPFDSQHPIRGNFGDPRTISAEDLGRDDLGDPGHYSFHNGVDISAGPGTPVYPVVSGVAWVRDRNEVIVRVPGGTRSFQYWHITSAVHTGERVVAGRTVLGRVTAPARHVHLSEIDHQRITNPAAHLRPYVDHTGPTVRELTFRDPGGRITDPDALQGELSIIAEADDTPPLPVPGAWDGFPVTPALLRWTLLNRHGRPVLPTRTIVDYRRREPAQRDFWQVYAAGTYQNFPVFEHRYYWRHAGRFLFNLTRRPLDTRVLPNGDYAILVTATDLCGNQGTLTVPITINNP